MPDCDLDQAVNGFRAAYGSAGERCMAQSVAVAGNIGDKLVNNLTKKVESLKVGPGMDKIKMGPLVTKEHLEKVKDYVNIGVKEGAELKVDGRDLKLQGYENGIISGDVYSTKSQKI